WSQEPSVLQRREFAEYEPADRHIRYFQHRRGHCDRHWWDRPVGWVTLCIAGDSAVDHVDGMALAIGSCCSCNPWNRRRGWVSALTSHHASATAVFYCDSLRATSLSRHRQVCGGGRNKRIRRARIRVVAQCCDRKHFRNTDAFRAADRCERGDVGD